MPSIRSPLRRSETPLPAWLRTVFFQVHLWAGLALALYVVFISVTGSAIVARREITRWAVPQTVPSATGPLLDDVSLRGRVQALYPDHVVVSIGRQRRSDSPVVATLESNGAETFRIVDPYTGADMGSTNPPALRALLWLIALHRAFLMGHKGLIVNGLASLACTVLFLTGLVIWWPGRGRWRAAMTIRARGWRSVNHQSHNAIGFWTSALLLIWGVSGVYFAFPRLFHGSVDQLFAPDSPGYHYGEMAIGWMVTLHFGRFGGWPVRVLWIVAGLMPAILAVSGAVMWWLRVVKPRRIRVAETTRIPTLAALPIQRTSSS